MAITIQELAFHRGLKTDSDGSYSLGAIEAVGLAMLGGCEHCEASIAAYNAYPSRSGSWRCEDCIGDSGYDTAGEANRDIFGQDSSEEFIQGLTGRELATVLHALRKLQDPTNCNHCCEHFDETEPLTAEEIDGLCERLNCSTLKPEEDEDDTDEVCPHCGEKGVAYGAHCNMVDHDDDPMNVSSVVCPEAVRGSEAWQNEVQPKDVNL